MTYKGCLLSSYKIGAKAMKVLDIGIGRTCQPDIPCKYLDKLYRPTN